MTDDRTQGGEDPNVDEDTRRWQDRLDSTIIAIPLLEEMNLRDEDEDRDEDRVFDVIVDLNLTYQEGREKAQKRVRNLVREAMKRHPQEPPADAREDQPMTHDERSNWAPQYLFAQLTAAQIRYVADEDDPEVSQKSKRAIHKIWLDHEVKPLLTDSVSTVKADAARIAFGAVGSGIVWAVVDSGIDKNHRHFAHYENLEVSTIATGKEGEPLMVHKDFTGGGAPLVDDFGHGTHVAGIIGGGVDPEAGVDSKKNLAARRNGGSDAGAGGDENGEAEGNETKKGVPVRAYVKQRNTDNRVDPFPRDIDRIYGVAPRCKLLSLKVLDSFGRGKVSNIIAALNYVQSVNEYGRWLHIQGVNLSVGYEYDAEWFACGQSPLCVEVDRLVRSGVVVVVAAGNTGYGFAKTEALGTVRAGIDVTINDPGNAEAAITVGSTHREKPHIYGVSYFSSKGPTGDGRLKPDLVAPGEKVISCASGSKIKEVEKFVAALDNELEDFDYVESSGTSMAAPHVSGAIAAFLSIRREFVGQADRVKEIFLDTATDLKRERYFQGHGLVDLMRAIQSV